ncbi:MAG: glycoside hydrolase family 3 C-terminal domain-containing protein [Paludibacter sp.]|nr:glycoside hydrolase family 3 C-terminal domain-containing protein [Paludibacter sp.]
MKKKLSIILVTLISIVTYAQNTAQYLDNKISLNERVEDALNRMTLEEKVALCHAQSRFSAPGVPRLGISELWMLDGPFGVRQESVWDDWISARQTNDSCIAFPALTCLAATWNPQLASNYGKALGEEFNYRNKNIALGPGINICRTPLNGRNFEYMGEDPYLTSVMCVPYIQGVQKSGVAACVKHYALNNQETNRDFVNVNVSQRALHEIYLPAFKAAVYDGKVWSIMGSYNKYEGQHCCENDYLLNKILKEQWGFDGVVISDWGGTYNTYEAAENGLDLEMGTFANDVKPFTKGIYGKFYLSDPYLKALRDGKVTMEKLNDKVRRLLLLTFRTAMNRNKPFGSFNTPEHLETARQIGEEGIVLLKNENALLPLNLEHLKNIAVIGDNATRTMSDGGGSSGLKVHQEITPLEGLQNKLGGKVNIFYAKGYSEKDDQANKLMIEALEVAKKSDIILFFGGLNKFYHQECEGADRDSYGLPFGQDKLIAELLKVNKNIVFLNISGSAVAMPWANQVPSILQAWYLGSETGNALANILTGDVNPSGKLPISFPYKIEDCGAHSFDKMCYPGDSLNVFYKEDILVGYRWYDTKNIPVQFCFGHGLSYTTFTFGKPIINSNEISSNDTLNISVPIRNNGGREGSEVVQLYIRDLKSTVLRPNKELKSFTKVLLKSGEEKLVSFKIVKEDLQFFDEKSMQFKVEKGAFEASIGSSSIDIRQKIKFNYK